MKILRKNVDYAGGLIIEGSDNVLINGYGAVRINDRVASHGSGIHAAAVMITGSSTVFVNGRPICRVNDLASCGHAGTGGSLNTYAG